MLIERPLSNLLPRSENSFGLLRLVCALAVVVSHAMVLASGDRAADPFLAWTGFKIADHAVNVFFILSGILTAQSLDRSRSIPDFVLARALRIWPALIAFALVFGFLIAPLVAASPDGTALQNRDIWAFVLRTVTFSPGLAELPHVLAGVPLAGNINESLWTLKYEVMCYAALAVGAILLHRLGRTAMIVAVGAVIALYILTIPASPLAGTLGHVRHFAFCYALGVGAYLARDHLPISITGMLATLAALIWSIGSPFQTLTTIVWVGYTAIWLASYDWFGLRQATTRTDLSYGTYIWAWPVGQVLLQVLPGQEWTIFAGLSIALVLPIAFLSWVLVERPALILKSVVSSAPNSVEAPIEEPKTDEPPPRPAGRIYARPLRSGW